MFTQKIPSHAIQKTSRAAWETHVTAHVLEHFLAEMEWPEAAKPKPAVPLSEPQGREEDTATWNLEEQAKLEASKAAAHAQAWLRRGEEGIAGQWLSRALELDPQCPRAMRIRGWCRFLSDNPEAVYDFEAKCIRRCHSPQTAVTINKRLFVSALTGSFLSVPADAAHPVRAVT